MMLRILSYVVVFVIGFIIGMVAENSATKSMHEKLGDDCPVCKEE